MSLLADIADELFDCGGNLPDKMASAAGVVVARRLRSLHLHGDTISPDSCPVCRVITELEGAK